MKPAWPGLPQAERNRILRDIADRLLPPEMRGNKLGVIQRYVEYLAEDARLDFPSAAEQRKRVQAEIKAIQQATRSLKLIPSVSEHDTIWATLQVAMAMCKHRLPRHRREPDIWKQLSAHYAYHLMNELGLRDSIKNYIDGPYCFTANKLYQAITGKLSTEGFRRPCGFMLQIMREIERERGPAVRVYSAGAEFNSFDEFGLGDD